MKKPKTIRAAIEDTIKTGRRWSLRGFPGLVLGTPAEFREHCMRHVQNWKNSPEFLKSLEKQFLSRIKTQ